MSGLRARALACAIAIAAGVSIAHADALAGQLLVPMDREQENHLKAYGFTFALLVEGQTGEWLLNYRAGSFLVSDTPDNRRKAALFLYLNRHCYNALL